MNSPEVSADDPMMEEASDDKPTPPPTFGPFRLHHGAGAGALQRCHSGGVAAAAGLGIPAQEEQRYNRTLRVHHRLAKGQIYGEFAREEAVVAIAAKDPNFMADQRVLYEAARNAHGEVGRGGGASNRGREHRQLRIVRAVRTICVGPQRPRGWPVHVYHGPHHNRRCPSRGL